MSDLVPEDQHFAKAVEQLGETQELVSSTAIYSAQGVKIIDQGVKISERLYERLSQHKLSAPLEQSLSVESAVNGKELRATAEALIAERPLFARMVAKPADRTLMLDLIETIPLAQPVAFQLTVARDVHPSLFNYFVATALTAAWLGQQDMVVRYDLSMLATAGLLHDLGMLHVDPVLQQPQKDISRLQRRQLYSHPLVSALLLERHHEYPKELIRAVREHHEMLDGSGYPSGLAGAAISPWGRILSLAQVVASLAKPGRSQPELRLSVLLRTNHHRFDSALIHRLLPLLQRPSENDAEPPAPTEGLVPNPVERLTAIHQLLAAWPGEALLTPSLPPAQRQVLDAISQRCADIRRTLVETGSTPDLLVSLDEDTVKGALAAELSLVTQELAWQVRALHRQILRRWGQGAEEAVPPALQTWLAQAEAASAGLIDN